MISLDSSSVKDETSGDDSEQNLEVCSSTQPPHPEPIPLSITEPEPQLPNVVNVFKVCLLHFS